jgi:hypothetical protein
VFFGKDGNITKRQVSICRIYSIAPNGLGLYDGWECTPKLSIDYRLNQVQNRL